MHSFVVVQYGNSGVDMERAVLEEFGRCMTQIINSAQTGWNLAQVLCWLVTKVRQAESLT